MRLVSRRTWARRSAAAAIVGRCQAWTVEHVRQRHPLVNGPSPRTLMRSGASVDWIQNLNVTPACTFTKTGSNSTGARPSSSWSRIAGLFSAPKRNS